MSRYLNQTFDDRDTTHLKYEGDWFLGGSYNASNVGETGTLSSTKDLNARVTFTFPVPAIAFYYYGIPRCCGGLYGICIDCDPLNPNFLPINAVNRTDDGKNPPIVLYSMRFNTPGIHEIIIRNENDTSVIPSGNSQLTIDRIDLEVPVDTVSITTFSGGSSTSTSTVTVIPSGGSSAASSGSSSTSSLTSSSSSSSSVFTPPLPANASSTPSQSQSSNSPPIGAIVGGALAGGFVLVLILLFLFWFRLKQKRKASSGKGNPGPSSSVQPQTQASSSTVPLFLPSTTAIVTPSSQNSSPANAQYPGRYGYAPRLPGKLAAEPYSPGPSPPSEVSSASTSQPSSTQVRREQDAGPLPIDTAESTLPPEYNQIFSGAIPSLNVPPR